MKCIKTEKSLLCVSIVSHGQGKLIVSLLSDLLRLYEDESASFEIILTFNISEDEEFLKQFKRLDIKIIRNQKVKGFGANHNAAFLQSNSNYFAVVNPDILVNSLDFRDLLAPFQIPEVAAVAPLVLSGEGKVEDSARRFPTLLRFVSRVLIRRRNPDYQIDSVPHVVDWVAGMFVVFKKDAYQAIGGFDDRRFFMYLEDADICRRLGEKSWKTLINPNVRVIHMAQRASRRNLKHMRWHLVSAFRFLTGL